ncbi:MAG TPA: hypothetical protein VLZ28_04795 [Daejeonella sp.]|nr:hypothetical protein [Daejeonella sp.]
MSCNSSPAPEEIQKGVHISLSADSSTVELHDVEPDVLAYLQKESLSNKEWQSLFAVYPDTNDPELRDLQFPLEGNYVIRDSFIVFLPKEAFKKDSAYFARFYRSQILMKPSDVIKEGNLSRRAEVVEFNFRR